MRSLLIFCFVGLTLAPNCYGARTSGRSPRPGWGETPALAAHSSAAGAAASFITAYLLLSRTASATPPPPLNNVQRSPVQLTSREIPRLAACKTLGMPRELASQLGARLRRASTLRLIVSVWPFDSRAVTTVIAAAAPAVPRNGTNTHCKAALTGQAALAARRSRRTPPPHAAAARRRRRRAAPSPGRMAGVQRQGDVASRAKQRLPRAPAADRGRRGGGRDYGTSRPYPSKPDHAQRPLWVCPDGASCSWGEPRPRCNAAAHTSSSLSQNRWARPEHVRQYKLTTTLVVRRRGRRHHSQLSMHVTCWTGSSKVKLPEDVRKYILQCHGELQAAPPWC